jgi:Probable Zinc-ribbon domain
LLAQYDPARNGNVPPEKRAAASQKDVIWVCSAHRTADGGGHDHVWSSPVERRTSGGRCPFCTGKQVCVMSSLRYCRPDLTKEWHQPLNGTLTPDDVSPRMNRSVFWKCLKDAAHAPFAQRIQQRAAESKRCPGCVEDEVRERTRKSTNASNQSQRDRAGKQRPVTLPPVPDSSTVDDAGAPNEPMVNVHEVSVALGRSDQTIRNWMRDGRIRARPSVGWGDAARIPQSEIVRLKQILAKPDDTRREAAWPRPRMYRPTSGSRPSRTQPRPRCE